MTLTTPGRILSLQGEDTTIGVSIESFPLLDSQMPRRVLDRPLVEEDVSMVEELIRSTMKMVCLEGEYQYPFVNEHLPIFDVIFVQQISV